MPDRRVRLSPVGPSSLPIQRIGSVSAERGQPVPEAQLVDELKARSEEAWASIYDRHYARLHRYAFARLGSADLAEDVAATVFQRALTAIDSYSYRGRPFLAWLYRIAANVTREYQRASLRMRATGRFKNIPFQPEGPSSRSSLERASAVAEASKASDPQALTDHLDLRRALGSLTNDQREVILLRYFAGLSAREASAVLAKTERAIYALQARAIEALRRHLE